MKPRATTKKPPAWKSPPPPRGARKRALLTVERLRELYTAATELTHENPFQLLIAPSSRRRRPTAP